MASATLELFQEGLFTREEIAEFRRHGDVIKPLAELPRVVSLDRGWRSPVTYRQRPYGPYDHLPQETPRRSPERRKASSGLRTFCYAAHHSQTKLCAVELEAIVRGLERYPGLKHVLYIGAAPGEHIVFLAEAFPNLEFHLVDPAEFRIALRYRDFPGVEARIHITRALFTAEMAEGWRERASETFLICDVRTGDHPQEEFEREVWGNMQSQREWWERARFAASLFKFRLPRAAGACYEYLAGEVLLQPFGPNTLAEGRLLVWGDAGYQVYDSKEYEDYYYWLNVVVREWASFDHRLDLSLVPGLCRCFDCSRTVQAFRSYVAQNPAPRECFDGEQGYIAYLIGRMVLATEQRLCAPPHGILPEILPMAKRPHLADRYGQAPGERRAASPGERRAASPGERRVAPSGERRAASPGERRVAPSGERRVAPTGERRAASPGEPRKTAAVISTSLPARLVEALASIRLPAAASFGKR